MCVYKRKIAMITVAIAATIGAAGLVMGCVMKPDPAYKICAGKKNCDAIVQACENIDFHDQKFPNGFTRPGISQNSTRQEWENLCVKNALSPESVTACGDLKLGNPTVDCVDKPVSAIEACSAAFPDDSTKLYDCVDGVNHPEFVAPCKAISSHPDANPTSPGDANFPLIECFYYSGVYSIKYPNRTASQEADILNACVVGNDLDVRVVIDCVEDAPALDVAKGCTDLMASEIDSSSSSYVPPVGNQVADYDLCLLNCAANSTDKAECPLNLK